MFQLLHNKELEREDLKEDVQEILSIEDEIDQVREALYREMGQPPRKQCQSCGNISMPKHDIVPVVEIFKKGVSQND